MKTKQEQRSQRVLLLHPYASNGKVFAKKSTSFLKLMGLHGCAVVAANAPHVMSVHGQDEDKDEEEDGQRLRWFRFGGDVEPAMDAPIEEYRKAPYLVGIEESIQYLRVLLSENPCCDGWVCFSQGAAFAALLLAQLAADDPIWVGLKWIVLASHFEVQHYSLVEGCMLSSPKMCPTLHIAGLNDTYVPSNLTREIFDKYFKQGPATFLEHDGKHHLPSKGLYREPLSRWFQAISN